MDATPTAIGDSPTVQCCVSATSVVPRVPGTVPAGRWEMPAVLAARGRRRCGFAHVIGARSCGYVRTALVRSPVRDVRATA